MLIEKWCQSEQSSHLDTDHTSTENFVKRYENSQGCVIRSVFLKCPRSQVVKVSRQSKNCASGTNLTGCVKRIGVVGVPNISSQESVE